MSDKFLLYTVTTSSDTETGLVARGLAKFLRPQDILTLNGPLGAGKTAFARALIQALCGAGIEVPSPTFNLLLTYDSDQAPIFHYDFYRLEDPEEVWELDIEDAFHEGITLIEWVERLEDLAPEDVLSIVLSIPEGEGSETQRVISIYGDPEWRERLKALAH